MINIDQFGLNWIRSDIREKLSEVHPEADAFQKICGNILADPVYKAASHLNLSFISFPTQGRDGAIDHYAFTDKDETSLIECKKNNSVKNSIEEIKRLKSKLLQNLSGKNAVNTIYKPWFNLKLERYIFCTSCQPANAAEFEEINSAIKEMIFHLGSIRTELSHLKSIEIKIYTWQQLKEWMERSPFLIYKWVEPDFEGIEYISRIISYSEGYRSYLSSAKIPYISRDTYIQKHPQIIDLPSENHFLETLINNTERGYKGLIIYGEGGIGKTRLMRELALKAGKRGWQPYKVNALVDFNKLIAFLRPEGKYILTFDYIEELPDFHEWVETLTQKERDFEVKIIANCRSSYISNVRVLSSTQFLRMDISNSSSSSNSYYNAVVYEIIKGIPALKNINNKIFKHRPSLAVFVRYLYDRDKKYNFDLRKDEDFRVWIIRRLELSFSKSGETNLNKELLAKIFTCLPTHGKGKEFLEDAYTSEINILIGDGWIENRDEFKDSEQKQLSVIHDTIADEVLLNYVEQNKHTIDVSVRKIFAFAAKNHLIYGCSRAFERISNSSYLLNFDFSIAFSKVINDYPDQMKDSYYHLVKTSLIAEEAMIPLYFKHVAFFDPYIRSADFAGPLSYLLNDFSKKNISDQLHQQVSDLYNWWNRCNDEDLFSNRYASKIISTSIKFFGPTKEKQKQIETYLNNSSEEAEASFVIGKWLEAGGDKEIVKNHIVNWLTQHAKSFEARFVIGNWLEADGDKAIVKDHMVNWLMQYHESLEARFVYSSWLEADGDKMIVQNHILNWLTQHEKSSEASFLIGKWLETGGDKSIVKPSITKWLTQYDQSFEAQFIYATWLAADGDKTIIKDHIVNWLIQHENSAEASFVIGKWLEAGGDKIIVKYPIIRWLIQYDQLVEAQFVYTTWLSADGDKTIIKDHIVNWLTQHEKCSEASFVISKWLEAGGDKTIVKYPIIKWLMQYDESFEAQFVYTTWLAADGEKIVIKDHLVNWLAQHEKSSEASFVIGEWLEAGGDLNVVEQNAINWLNIHANKPEASYIFQPYLKLGGNPVPIENSFAIWLNKNELKENSFYSIGMWLQKGGNLNNVRKYVAEYIDKFNSLKIADRLLNAWLDAGGEVPFKL